MPAAPRPPEVDRFRYIAAEVKLLPSGAVVVITRGPAARLSMARGRCAGLSAWCVIRCTERGGVRRDFTLRASSGIFASAYGARHTQSMNDCAAHWPPVPQTAQLPMF